MEPHVLEYDPWGLGSRAVLQGPAQWPPLGPLTSVSATPVGVPLKIKDCSR